VQKGHIADISFAKAIARYRSVLDATKPGTAHTIGPRKYLLSPAEITNLIEVVWQLFTT